ncbi:hypothetical protein [Bradyrhizobium sp. B117]|uniref:hypothetical protein n=1 Tax=Bradyrhizobium sp. B117 TaxID=3140246 RepID=UPI003183E2BA
MDGSGAQLLHFFIERVYARGAVICHRYCGVGIGDEYCQTVIAVISSLAASFYNLKRGFSSVSGDLRVIGKRINDWTASGGCAFNRLVKLLFAWFVC